jgi:hypothetical protein
MERNYFLNHRLMHEKLSLHLQKLLNRSKTRTSLVETLKTSRSIGFLFFSIILGWISIQATQNQATLAYQKTHWPKALVWNQTLEHRGLVQQSALGAFTSAIKNHPNPYSQDQSIWVSQDACLVYIPKSHYKPEAELWACENNPGPTHWSLMGEGTQGFENLIDFFEKTPQKSKLKQLAQVYKIDPKEFRY